MPKETSRREGRNDRGDGAGCCSDGESLEQRRQSVLKRRRVVRAKLAQKAREKHKEGVVDELPSHAVDLTPGWQVYPVIKGKAYDVYRFEGTAETAIPRHRHPEHLELIYVVEGEVNLRLGREDRLLTKGEIQRIEPDIEHEIICASRDTTLVSIFQPPISVGPNGEEVENPLDYREIFQQHA